MLLSIIVPAYNVEKYLEKCIKSLLGQKNISYEIIIINDGSTDKTLYIAENLSKENSNVRVINQKNKGLGGARNTGINNAKGKYITFVDSDDYLVENAYGKIFKEIQDDDFDIINFKYMKIYEGKDFTISNSECIDKKIIEGNEVMRCFYENKISSYAWDKIYNINLFKNNNIYYPEKKLYEDLRTSYEIIRKAKKIIKLDYTCYFYLQRNGSISKSIQQRNLDDFTSEYLHVLNYIEKDTYSKFFKNEIIIYKVLKYNAIIRMKMKSKNNSYIINEKIKFKLSLFKLIKNNNIPLNEKIINLIGENKRIFRLFQSINNIIR